MRWSERKRRSQRLCSDFCTIILRAGMERPDLFNKWRLWEIYLRKLCLLFQWFWRDSFWSRFHSSHRVIYSRARGPIFGKSFQYLQYPRWNFSHVHDTGLCFISHTSTSHTHSYPSQRSHVFSNGCSKHFLKIKIKIKKIAEVLSRVTKAGNGKWNLLLHTYK